MLLSVGSSLQGTGISWIEEDSLRLNYLEQSDSQEPTWVHVSYCGRQCDEQEKSVSSRDLHSKREKKLITPLDYTRK